MIFFLVAMTIMVVFLLGGVWISFSIGIGGALTIFPVLKGAAPLLFGLKSWDESTSFILVALPLAPVLAGLFTEKAEVLKLTTLYIRIMAFNFLFGNIIRWTSLKLNAVGKPVPAMLLNVLGIGCIVIPGVVIGAWLYNYAGMLLGLVVGNAVLALIAVLTGRSQLHVEQCKG